MESRREIDRIGARALRGARIGPDEARRLAAASGDAVFDVIRWAGRVRTRWFGRHLSLCCIVPGKLGGCAEDCAWCAQSTRRAPPTPAQRSRRTPPQDVLAAATRAREIGASCFCVVDSGRRPTEPDLQALASIEGALHAAGLPPACASLGELDSATASRLRRLGVRRYNHNLETSRARFGRVVRTHRFEDRLRTLRVAREAGLGLCSGGLFGIGESWDDRIELALLLRDEVGPEVVPLNFLSAVPGTRLAGTDPLPPLTCLHIIALFRLVLPRTDLKVAGGRPQNLRDLQCLVFEAGATSLMVGDYLTTCGRPLEEDLRMIRDLEMTVGNDPAERIGTAERAP